MFCDASSLYTRRDSPVDQRLPELMGRKLLWARLVGPSAALCAGSFHSGSALPVHLSIWAPSGLLTCLGSLQTVAVVAANMCRGPTVSRRRLT